jgi:transcriptional regulator with XRE-family HTH domain
VDDAPSYDRIVADNITAARARRRLSQKDVAARMEALGFGWRQQIVAAAESGRRRIAVAEVLGLALALETSFISLLEPVRDDGPIALPSGQTMLFLTVHELIWGGSELTVSWNGNVPEFPSKDPLMSATGYVVPPPKIRRRGDET